MAQKIRWGILSTGNIAKKFATGLGALPDAEIVAVGSRSQSSADAFGEQFAIPHRHSSYQALAEDPDVDVIYVATPHTLHCEDTLVCLNAGKAVLCEKPFAINAGQARQMVALARAKGLFLMDAVWTRFLPIQVKLREMLKAGTIGEVRMVEADFGFRTAPNPEGRLMNLALGGGALLDIGIYTAQLASMILGTPAEIRALGHLGTTGVDEQTVMLFGYPEGRHAVLSCAVRTTTHHEASIYGTEGRIRLHTPWWRGTTLSVYRQAGPEDAEVIDAPYESNGYNYEAAEVMRCLRAGRLESEVMPLDETVQLMESLDAVRAQIGLKYPGE